MKNSALIIVLAASSFAAAFFSTDQRSLGDLAGTSWDLSAIATAQGSIQLDGIEQVLVFPHDGANRFDLVTQCGETSVFYTPAGLGGHVVAANWNPNGRCQTAIQVNLWTQGTQFWLRTDGESLTFDVAYPPEVDIPESLARVYTRKG